MLTSHVNLIAVTMKSHSNFSSRGRLQEKEFSFKFEIVGSELTMPLKVESWANLFHIL